MAAVEPWGFLLVINIFEQLFSFSSRGFASRFHHISIQEIHKHSLGLCIASANISLLLFTPQNILSMKTSFRTWANIDFKLFGS